MGGVPGRGPFSNSWTCCVFFAWKSVIAREFLLKRVDTLACYCDARVSRTNLLFEKPREFRKPPIRFVPTESCHRGPKGPGLRSVQKVSRECPEGVRDTFLTLWGHSRDTFWTLRSAMGTPRRTLPFSDTPHSIWGHWTRGHAPGTCYRARRARESSCSRPAGSQGEAVIAGGVRKCRAYPRHQNDYSRARLGTMNVHTVNLKRWNFRRLKMPNSRFGTSRFSPSQIHGLSRLG